jgi:two-component system, LytTR family, response regulator
MLRALLVDDEEIARRGLRIRLEQAGDIVIVGECANGKDALAAIEQLAPDVVFLDIQMPELSGMAVAQSLPPACQPRIVFITAFDHYAIRAFEVHAIDYLLKPIDDERLAATLQHVHAAVHEQRDGAYARQVLAAVEGLRHDSRAAPPGSDRIAVPNGDRVTVVRIPDIDWVGALGNYVSLHVGKKSLLLRETISSMEQRLVAHGFVRIHRSTIVNIHRVTELRSLSNAEFSVGLADGTTLKLSRNYRDALERLTGHRS